MSIAERITEILDAKGVNFSGFKSGDRLCRRVPIKGPKGKRFVVEYVNTDGTDRDVFVVPDDPTKIRDVQISDFAKLLEL